MAKARVSHIQHFSLGDGPGIRTTVFFQGCSLHCPWCHNPETLPHTPVLLYHAARCTGCGQCAALCAQHTFAADGHRLQRAGCSGCGRCAAACPAGALERSGREWEIPALLEEVLEDREFYETSGGGITLSGGEALLQPDACAQLAAACRQKQVSVLLDTAGFVPAANLQQLLPHLDMCYFDIKSAQAADYAAIGGTLPAVLHNLRLCAQQVFTVARVPVIPGWNQDPQHMAELAQLLQGVGVQRVDLLPFHRLAAGKYAALGLTYAYGSTPPLQPAMLEPLCAPFIRAGLPVQIEA